jgi:hypothetical protein
VLLSRLVVEEDLALEEVPQPSDLDPLGLRALGVLGRGLEQVQRAARVAARRLRDEREGVVVEPEVAGAEPARNVPQRALDDPRDRLRGERLEHDDLAAGQERAVELEGRVLGRRAHEHDVPRLDVRQEDVLLRAVEAVDLVEEEDRPLGVPGAHRTRLLEHLAHLLHARRDGGVREEDRGGLRGDQPRQRGLAHARRAPEDQRRDAVLGDRAPQEPVGADDLGRPLDLVERARPHAVRERRGRDRSAAGPPAPRGGCGSSKSLPLIRPRASAGSPPSRRTPSRRRGGREGEPPVEPRAAHGVADHLALEPRRLGRVRGGLRLRKHRAEEDAKSRAARSAGRRGRGGRG